MSLAEELRGLTHHDYAPHHHKHWLIQNLRAILAALEAQEDPTNTPAGQAHIASHLAAVARNAMARELPALREANRWTVKEAMYLKRFADAMAQEDYSEAYNVIYWIVSDRSANPFYPWAEIETLAALPAPPEEI